MDKRGLFITFEGGEGVGKSTNLTYLSQYLMSNGIDVVTTREPGGTLLGEETRELLLRVRRERVSALSELLLIFAARSQHIHELIEPALATGKWVLCDRFTDATYAYQCGGRGIDREAVEQLEDMVQGKLRPDYTVLLDASVAIGMARAKERGNLDRIEREDVSFFERVRQSYLQQAQCSKHRYRLIDASLPLEEVQQQLLGFGRELLSQWPTESPDLDGTE